MKEHIIKLYQYDELSDDVKEKVRCNLWDINFYQDWYEFIYEDAANIGLKIKEFDIDRGNSISVEPIEYEEKIAKKIVEEHGEGCETYSIAKKYLEDIKEIKEKYLDEEEDNGLTYAGDEALDELNGEFLKELGEEYLSLLRKEYEYLTSEESIEESIRVNEYEFTENGKVFDTTTNNTIQ